ncbi:MAG: VOC family protein [Gammaproteobacteria bacterium]|nr:VOC family protein [Gammaproteobacteria bacterium]
MRFSLTSIHHGSVVVADIEASLAFYCNILGLMVDPARPDLGYPGAWLCVGQQQIHLLAVDNVDPVAGRPAHVGRDRHIAFQLENIDALAEQLEYADISYTRSRSGRNALFCRDPDGNGLEFIQVITQ